MKFGRYFCFLGLLLSLTALHGRGAWGDTATTPAVTPPPASVATPVTEPVATPVTRVDKEPSSESPEVEAVDIPTADILDAGTYSTAFRFYSEGGITSRLDLGPLRRVNLGISFDGQHIIGGGDPHMIRPSVYFKVRAFDGNDYLPALALGYDSQGYLWQTNSHNFLEKEKGLYAVGTHEILIPDLNLHAGANINDFDHTKVYGFFGLTYRIVESFGLMAEYDNIRNARENRVNLGGRYWLTPFFNIDVDARNVGRGAGRGAERIVLLNYVGNFPFIK